MFEQQNLNARQARWLAFLSEYDIKIQHSKGNINKVVDALRINAITSSIDTISSYKTELDDKLEKRIKLDTEYQNLRDNVTNNKSKNVKIDYNLNEKGLMLYKNRLYVPNIPEIKLLILNEVHKITYSGHLGYQKMITMLRK